MYTFLVSLAIGCLFIAAYQYVLYPAAIILAAKLFGRSAQARPAAHRPKISLVIAGYNEARILPEKLQNTGQIRYEPFDVIVVTDGSDDGSETLEMAVPGRKVTHLHDPERAGKAPAMNRGVAASDADIIVFSDANALYNVDALTEIADAFSDPDVGLVSGCKTVMARGAADGDRGFAKNEGLYWKYENLIRRSEDKLGNTVATVGEMLAVRRDLFPNFPRWVVNDDAYLTLHVLRAGQNVRYAEGAASCELASLKDEDEAKRRARIAVGRWELVSRPALWPAKRPFAMLQLISHKWLRLITPFLLIIALASTALAVAANPGGLVATLLLAAQLAFYAVAAFGKSRESAAGPFGKLARLCWFLLRSNLSILSGFFAWAGRSRPVAWERAER